MLITVNVINKSLQLFRPIVQIKFYFIASDDVVFVTWSIENIIKTEFENWNENQQQNIYRFINSVRTVKSWLRC